MLLRCGLATLAALVALGSTAHVAPAQASITVAGGATVPVGDFGDYAKTGYIATVGLMFKVGTQGLSVGAQGLFGSNSHSDIDGDRTNLSGGLGTVMYRLGDATKPGVFLVGNVGYLTHSYKSDKFPALEGSDSGVAYGGGAGFAIPRGSMNIFGVVRYLMVSVEDETTSFIPIQLGLSFPLGGNN